MNYRKTYIHKDISIYLHEDRQNDVMNYIKRGTTNNREHTKPELVPFEKCATFNEHLLGGIALA